MPGVFISHSSLDHELIRTRIVEPIERHGLEVWYSRDSIHAAEEWERRIRHALVSTDWFLVALSANSVRSEWVRAEVDWAFENRRGKLVPVLIGDCDPQDCHLRLRQIQYIDLRDADGPGKAALLAIWGLGPTPDPRDPSPVTRRPIGTRRRSPTPWLVGSAALLVAALVWAAWGFFAARPGGKPPVPAPPSAPASPASIAPTPTPAPAPAPPTVVVEWGLDRPPDPPAPRDDDPDRETRVTYDYRREGGTLHVAYHLPYLDRQREAKAIEGLRLDRPPFDWKVPALSAKVLNTSPQSVMLTECVVEVKASRIDAEPVLVVAGGSVNALLLVNEGWGDVVDPVLTFTIRPSRAERDREPPALERHTLELKSFAKDILVPIVKYVPDSLGDDPVAVDGALEFGASGRRRTIPFTTWVIFEITHGAAAPPSYTYNLALTAGKAPETVLVPVSHSVKPGEADQFLLRIGSDRSAHYELTLAVRLIDGRLLPVQDVVLDVFVPRSMVKRGKPASSVDAGPTGEVP